MHLRKQQKGRPFAEFRLLPNARLSDIQLIQLNMLSVRATVVLSITLVWVSPVGATNVAMCTDMGRVVIELFDEDAPEHVANFLEYTDRGFYGGTVFHRVIEGFVVQGGGFDKDLRGKRPSRTVPNESRNGHDNVRGTVAAARTSAPDSASSQFFINVTDNPALDATRREAGYTVFGRVIDGMPAVDEISRLPTGAAGGFTSDVPDPLISITSITRLEEEQLSNMPHTERHNLIREEIAAARAAGDEPAAFQWLRQFRNACGTMGPDLLLTESRAALAVENEPAALGALEEYLRVADDTHAGFAGARDTYLELIPDAPVNDSTQIMEPGISELAAHCVAPTDPPIPDARMATMDEMVQGQTAVRAYMAASNEHLECLSEIIDDDETGKEERALLASVYNRVVDTMEAVAADFNDQVRLIRARE